MNLFSSLRARYRPRLDAPFLRVPASATLTYRQVEDRSARLAGGLAGLGVGVGDRVVVQVDKSPDAVALYLACLRLGAVHVPLNTAYTDAEVGDFVDDAEPAVVVGRPGTLDGVAATLVDMAADGTGTLAEAAAAATSFEDVAARRPDDLAAMLYTSGTTGRSKGAMLTHANLETNAVALHDIWGFGPDDVLLHVLPVFHVHGLFVALHCAMLGGNEVVFLPRFDVDAVIEHLPQATVMMGVPTHYTRLLADRRFDAGTCRSIRLFTSGSAPMTTAVHEEFTARTGAQIVERYGMTEAGMITSNPYDPRDGERTPGTVGYPLPGVDLRVVDRGGDVVAAGETGVVEIRSPGLFAGYWRRPEQTAAEFRSDGWFVTGDVGSVDADGRLTLEGRANDMIISGGFNVYPKEIELVLDAVPGIEESAVIGVAHPDLGEAVVAVVVRDGTANVTDDDLAAALDGRLARFKHPKRFVVADELPRNAMSKVQKAELRRDLAGLFGT